MKTNQTRNYYSNHGTRGQHPRQKFLELRNLINTSLYPSVIKFISKIVFFSSFSYTQIVNENYTNQIAVLISKQNNFLSN